VYYLLVAYSILNVNIKGRALAVVPKKAFSFNRQIAVKSPLTGVEGWDRTWALEI
jgi:hypothetical protein